MSNNKKKKSTDIGWGDGGYGSDIAKAFPESSPVVPVLALAALACLSVVAYRKRK